MKKKLFKLFKIGFVLFITFSIGGYMVIRNYWKKYIPATEIAKLVLEIKNAEHLPDVFYKLYEIEQSSSLNKDLTYRIWKESITGNHASSPSNQVARISLINNRLKTRDKRVKPYIEYSLALKIEEETNQRECLNWIAERYDFTHQVIGVKNLAFQIYAKEIDKLNERELASVIIMMKNPMLYNPRKKNRLKLLNSEVDKLMKQYQERTLE